MRKRGNACWPPHGYQPPKPPEQRVDVFRELLATFIVTQPGMARGVITGQWLTRYTSAVTEPTDHGKT